MKWFALVLLFATLPLPAADLVLEPRLVPLTPKERRLERPHPKSVVQFTPEVFSDRVVYWNDDGVGQFVVPFFFCDLSQPGKKIQVVLANASTTLESHEIAVTETNAAPKLAFLLNTDALKPGDYTVRASLVAGDGKEIAVAKPCEFKRVNKTHPKVPIPSRGIPLLVHSQDEMQSAVWPITTGVPMPFGTLTDSSNLTLLEDGKPVAAQWATRATWAPGSKSSIQWLGLDFLARYEKGKPKEYRIVQQRSRPAGSPSLAIKETADSITVDTGAIRFQVNRKQFNGIDAAWRKWEAVSDGRPSRATTTAEGSPVGDGLPHWIKVIEAAKSPSGPYLHDSKGILYQAAADDSAEVRIEEQGPVRVTIVARGWYANKTTPESKLCQFVTRVTAYAGQPVIDVNQRTIITYDTRSNQLANISFAVPVVGATNWATSIDGKTINGGLPVWLHQERADRVRLMEVEKGQHADGWLSVSTPNATVTGFLRDIWQRFPKELEADRDGLVVHFWPKHGRRVFAEAEELDKRNIYKAWFAHQGSLMDLQMPKNYFDLLQKWNDTEKWDPEHTSEIGYMASGEGVAIGNEFRIELQPGPAQPGDFTKHARLFQQNPHAIAAPSWNAATLVMGHLAARDDKRWPEVERLLNDLYPTGMFNTVAYLGDYGMWIYGNTHNPWDNTQPRLHRIWQNSHYQHVGNNWVLYFRSGSPELLRWARANTDEYMDVGTCNYHNPERPLKGHITGAMYHAKGFVPWGSRHYGMFKFDTDIGLWGHWIDPDAFLFRYYLEGDPRAHDLYQAWSAALFTGSLPYGPGRELSNTIGMMLSYYQATWDPNAIMDLRYMANGMLETPFEKFVPGFPMWHRQWLDRYYDLTRDERAVAAIQSYIAAGYNILAPNAFAYRTTGNKKYLERVLPEAYDTARMVYENPGDPLHGFGPYAMATGIIPLRELPYVLQAMETAGIRTLAPSPEDKSYYPVGRSHLYSQTRRNEIAMTILALDPDDREFKITIEPLDRNTHPSEAIVISPSGKIVHETGPLRPQDDTTKRRLITIPKDGEKGVYSIELYGEMPLVHAPLTDLPNEVARVPKGAEIRAPGRQMGYLILPPNSAVTLKLAALGYGQIPAPNYARVADLSGKTLLETSLLSIGQRKEATVDLKSGATPAAFPYYAVSWLGPTMSWTGDAQALYLARRADDAEPILKALSQTTNAPPAK